MDDDPITDWDEFRLLAKGTVKSKVCIKCNIDKPLSAYGRHSSANFLRSECRSCNSKLGKVTRKLRETTSKPNAEYTCPICKGNEEEVKGRGGKRSGSWVLDHDHIKETFRGWLCHSCNRAIGNFADDIERLKRAILYLSNDRKVNDNE